jgi:hypothetical protein
MGTIARYMRPTVAAVMNEKPQLRDQNLRAGLGDLDPEIMLQLGGSHRLTDQLSQLTSPLSLLHGPSKILCASF